MGLFERVDAMVGRRLLDVALIYDFYGYRVANIWANQRIREQNLKRAAASWKHFIDLTEKLYLHGEGIRRDEPERPLPSFKGFDAGPRRARAEPALVTADRRRPRTQHETAPDRLIVELAVLCLLSEAADERPQVCGRRRRVHTSW
jgi:hypothetical protein